MPPATNPAEFAKRIRAKTPALLEIGKTVPKAVLSFGGAGFLVTYELGVASFLCQEKSAFLQKCFFLGAGSGVIPAVALACGVNASYLEKIRDFIVDHRFMVADEAKRVEAVSSGISELLPQDCSALMRNRIALTVGFSNRDPGFKQQKKEHFRFGYHISDWKDFHDVAQNILVAMAPNTQKPMVFRDANNVLRGTMMSLSSELDQYCRHIYIHGYVGLKRNKQQSIHNVLFGRHGYIGNTHFPFWKQAICAFAPIVGGEARKVDLLDAFDAGYHDARRYERWEEDPYFFAKADRSPSDDINFKNMRASLLNRKGSADRFEL